MPAMVTSLRLTVQNTPRYSQTRRTTRLPIARHKSISARPKKINSEEVRTYRSPGHIQLSAFCTPLQDVMSAPKESAGAEQHLSARASTRLRLILHSPGSRSSEWLPYEAPTN